MADNVFRDALIRVRARRYIKGPEELFESSIDDIRDRSYAHILKEPGIAALFEDDQPACHARSNSATMSTGSHFKDGFVMRGRSAGSYLDRCLSVVPAQESNSGATDYKSVAQMLSSIS